MEPLEFKAWPKIARLNRKMVVTEKIDGTNAAVGVLEDGRVYAQSRTQLITPERDNHGFARWVADNEDTLRADLSVGLHFGEWWGSGIQRGYGLAKGEKRFSLFNTSRWEDVAFATPAMAAIPVIGFGPFNSDHINECLRLLEKEGSLAAEGFMKPEGVVVFHVAGNVAFKVTLEKDDEPKGVAA